MKKSIFGLFLALLALCLNQSFIGAQKEADEPFIPEYSLRLDGKDIPHAHGVLARRLAEKLSKIGDFEQGYPKLTRTTIRNITTAQFDVYALQLGRDNTDGIIIHNNYHGLTAMDCYIRVFILSRNWFDRVDPDRTPSVFVILSRVGHLMPPQKNRRLVVTALRNLGARPYRNH